MKKTYEVDVTALWKAVRRTPAPQAGHILKAVGVSQDDLAHIEDEINPPLTPPAKFAVVMIPVWLLRVTAIHSPTQVDTFEIFFLRLKAPICRVDHISLYVYLST